MDSIEERTTSKWDLFGNKKMVLPFNWRYDPRSRVVRKAIKTVRSVLVDKQKWAQDHSQCLSFTFGQMVVVQNTYRSTLVGCKVRDIESTRFGPKTWTQRSRENPVQLSPITVANPLPGTVRQSLQFLDERTVEKYLCIRHQTVLSSFSPGQSRVMLGFRLGDW